MNCYSISDWIQAGGGQNSLILYYFEGQFLVCCTQFVDFFYIQPIYPTKEIRSWWPVHHQYWSPVHQVSGVWPYRCVCTSNDNIKFGLLDQIRNHPVLFAMEILQNCHLKFENQG